MRLPLNNCCFCSSLRMGTLILGWLYVVLAIALLFSQFGSIMSSSPGGATICIVLFAFVAITIAGLLLVGVRTQTPWMLLPWLVCKAINAVGLIVLLIMFGTIFSGAAERDIKGFREYQKYHQRHEGYYEEYERLLAYHRRLEENNPRSEEYQKAAIWTGLIIFWALYVYFFAIVYTYYKELKSSRPKTMPHNGCDIHLKENKPLNKALV